MCSIVSTKYSREPSVPRHAQRVGREHDGEERVDGDSPIRGHDAVGLHPQQRPGRVPVELVGRHERMHEHRARPRAAPAAAGRPRRAGSTRGRSRRPRRSLPRWPDASRPSRSRPSSHSTSRRARPRSARQVSAVREVAAGTHAVRAPAMETLAPAPSPPPALACRNARPAGRSGRGAAVSRCCAIARAFDDDAPREVERVEAVAGGPGGWQPASAGGPPGSCAARRRRRPATSPRP